MSLLKELKTEVLVIKIPLHALTYSRAARDCLLYLKLPLVRVPLIAGLLPDTGRTHVDSCIVITVCSSVWVSSPVGPRRGAK